MMLTMIPSNLFSIVIVLVAAVVWSVVGTHPHSFDATDHARSTARTHHQQQLRKSMESDYLKWLSSFKAATVSKQTYCEKILKSQAGSESQFGQDLFVYYNFFKYWPMMNRTGFYVDSGANDPINISNTYFYDVCLGWQGLCVEPESRYHQRLKEERSCLLVPKCISDVPKNVSMNHEGALSTVVSDRKDDVNTECEPLSDMLKNHPAVDPQYPRVDFWSLDVEGYELTVLNSLNFSTIDIKVILTEDMWISSRLLNKRLSESGYLLYHQMSIDTVHTKIAFPGAEEKWYPASYNEDWKLNEKFRQENRAKIPI